MSSVLSDGLQQFRKARNPDLGFFSLRAPSAWGKGGTGSLVSPALAALADLRLLLLLFLLRVKMLRFEPRRAAGGVSGAALGAGDMADWEGTCCEDEVLEGILTDDDDFGLWSGMVSFDSGREVAAGPGASFGGTESPIEEKRLAAFPGIASCEHARVGE